MRLADILVDLAIVASAARSVASKHVALRAGQIERYGQTSSVASALRQKQKQQPQPSAAQDQEQENEKPAPDTEPTGSPGRDAAPESGARDAPEPGPATSVAGPELGTQHSSSRPDLGGMPSMRVGNLPPRSAPTPSSTSNQPRVSETPVQLPKTSEFVPAPWASGISGFVHQTPARPPPRAPGSLKPGNLGGIDLNIFHTRKASGILESLQEAAKEAERESQEGKSGLEDGFESVGVKEAVTESVEEPVSPPSPKAASLGDVVEPVSHIETLSPKIVIPETSVPEEPLKPQDSATPTPASSTPHESTQQPEKKLSQEDIDIAAELAGTTSPPTHELRESRVPSTRIGRIWNYSGLAAGMLAGAMGEGFSRALGGGGQGSVMLSPANMERLVAKLSRMRGAALKMGQMLSFQDSKMLPPAIQEVLQRVQDRADYMPAWQRDRVMATNLGADWRELFDRFDEKPIAAASIGQVHRATLKSSGAEVAVKVQFPGVADSIHSDLDNLGILLAATKLLPKGLYLNKTIDNMRTELSWECDYAREAECAQRYRSLLGSEADVFAVPQIFPEASGAQVLTMEFMPGVGVTRVKDFTQDQKDWIGTQILRLCLREITEFRFMQTDPNWTNFQFNADRQRLELLDFGASREYPDRFVDLYVRLLEAASRMDRHTVKVLSEELGYLTGHESRAMLDAHTTSVLTLAEPFMTEAPEEYDFRDQTITERVKAQIPVMIRERLAPPPEETYSLHRKLSGAFLLCARLGSRVRCREMFENALGKAGYTT